MNILAIDFGSKNIGLAWCDTAIGVVLPYGQIKNTKGQKELFELIAKEKIDQVVVGLPLDLNGKDNENTARIRVFGQEIEENTKVAVEFFSEIFSSQQADRMVGGVSRDEKSAMVILESYLDDVKLKNQN